MLLFNNQTQETEITIFKENPSLLVNYAFEVVNVYIVIKLARSFDNNYRVLCFLDFFYAINFFKIYFLCLATTSQS